MGFGAKPQEVAKQQSFSAFYKTIFHNDWAIDNQLLSAVLFCYKRPQYIQKYTFCLPSSLIGLLVD